jgi:hypothetical protein
MAISQVLKSTDGGVTWSSLEVTTHYTVDTANNTITFVTAPLATDLIIVNYRAYNNNLTPIANSRVIGGSAGVSNVWAGGHYSGASYGGTHVSKLINKVMTNGSDPIYDEVPLKRLIVNLNNGNQYQNTTMPIIHNTISLYGSASPAVKTFSYLTQNTRAKQVYVFKEMKFNSDWGDDNKFNIINNIGTVVDDNGSTVLVGQKARLIDGRIKE